MEKRDMKWQTLKSDYIIRRPWLTARRDTVKLPNGVINDEYYVLEYPTWVNIIAITKDGEYVFIRQYRHGIDETNFEIVAGVCEEGEEPVVSAQRELLEETGYAGGEWKEIMTISANTSTMNNLSHCFLATGVEKVSEQHLDKTEDIEVHLLSEADVMNLLENGEIRQALMAAPLWKYFYDKK
ncbi:MAG: NUDIX hydrolase [Prevotellaceae bacterium]|nr:NUDIX hydrolase [Prevotellaceae bacterium]